MLTGVAIASASAGALLAWSMATIAELNNPLNASTVKGSGQNAPISSGLSLRFPQLTRPVNILVLGVKVLASDLPEPPTVAQTLSYDPVVNSLEGLADTILLIRFDPETRKVAVLSIPRDTRTWVEGVGVTKLNEANLEGGAALAAQATSELLDGIAIDRYIRVNVQAVEKLINALGGVTIYVPKDLHYQDDAQHLYINLKQGKQHLDGNQALQFLRYRYDDYGDIGRIQRQQMFLRSLSEQALTPATLMRLPQLLSVIRSNIDTNLSVDELLALVGFATQVDRDRVQMLMLPGDFSAPDEYEASYWLPDSQQISTLVEQYFDRMPNFDRMPTAKGDRAAIPVALDGSAEDPAEPATSILLAIQDTTDSAELAQQGLNRLNQAGYRNAFIDTPWSEPLAVTRIIAQRGDRQAAEAIRARLGFGQVQVESTGNLASDITIQLGKDAQSRWISNSRGR